MKLDKSKSYAQIFGSTDGSRYEQGGIVFDFEGNELNANPIANSSFSGTTETPKPTQGAVNNDLEYQRSARKRGR